MSKHTEDARTKITPEDLAFLNAVALGMKKDSASILRDLIREFLAAKRHEYTVTGRILHGEGMARDSQGDDE